MALFSFDIHTLIALLFIGNLMSAIILFAYKSGGVTDRACLQRLYRIFGWIYGLFCLILALAASAELTPDESGDAVQALAFLMMYLFMLVGGTGFLLLLKERDDRRLKTAYDALAEREKQLRMQALVLDQIQDQVTITDLNGIVTYINRTQARALGTSPDARVGQHVSSYGDGQQADATQQEIVDATLTLGAWRGRVVNECADGSQVILDLRTTLVRDEAGEPVAMVGIGTDISERLQTEQILRTSQRQLADIIDFLPDALLAIDQDKRVIIWNKAIETMTGIPAAEMLGRGDYAYTIPFYGEPRSQLMDLVFLDHPSSAIMNRYANVTHEGDTVAAEAFCNALYDGRGAWIFAKISPLRDINGQIVGAIEIIRDVTERKRLEEELRRLATQDPLTGLLNRRHFFILAEQEYERFLRYQRPLALFMVDIDHFKAVNDRYGHLVGDEVLRAVASRIRNGLRQVDILARYGGEEFVLLLPETDLETARALAERLRISVAELQIDTKEGTVSVTLSLGVAAISNGISIPFEQLLDVADRLLYQAKQAGRNRVEVWDVGVESA